jgi:cobalt/nickel transport system permease protein
VLEVALLAYRFIFVILHTAAQIYTAQQSRLGYSNLTRSIRSIGILAANLGRKSFMTARALFIGLSSRNYSERLVFRYPPQRVEPTRLTLIVAVFSLSVWLSR